MAHFILSDTGRDWPEDATHENGDYECLCVTCGKRFTGHKRRVVCKLCSAPTTPTNAGGDDGR